VDAAAKLVPEKWKFAGVWTLTADGYFATSNVYVSKA
jgi:hypothetical protein